MPLTDGDPGTLFHLNLKVNTWQRGFNFKFHLKGADYAAVMPGCIGIADRMKGIMPTDSEIFYAAVSMDNSNRESKFVRDALGDGKFAQTGDPLPAKPFDNSRSGLLVRFEISDGLWVSRVFNPIPDEVMTDGDLVNAITDITAPVIAAPAAYAGADTYAQAWTKFLQAVMFWSVFVKAGHPPGGAYRSSPWSAAYVLRQGVKKGGRVFSS